MLSAEIRDIFAICVGIMVVGGLIGGIVGILRRSPFTPAQSTLYAVNYSVARVLWRTRIQGSFPISPNQGAVIVCNHCCPLDPSFIALTVPRVIHWMVAQEYCEYPLFRRLMRLCEVIPVRRGRVDMTAMRAAIRLVESGELVGVFPEGRINTTGQILLPGRPGAAMIALKARAPIVPCYLAGAPYDGTSLGCLLMPASVRLHIGLPIEVAAYCDADDQHDPQKELTRRLLQEIARLGGQPDYEPQLAGRFHASDQ